MNVHKVLDNVELLGIILEFSTNITCARLLTTSRTFFNSAAPRVWKTLQTPRNLILLIPKAHELTPKYEKPILQLPPPPADFSRFDFYARFVHSLCIFGRNGRGKRNDFTIDASWQTMIFRARQSPLLPNLSTLILDEPFDKEDEPALWVSAFASGSLKSFQARKLTPKSSGVNSSFTSVILGLVIASCPDLQNLRLYVGPPHENIETSLWAASANSPNLLRIVLGVPASQAWQSIRNLRSLVTDIHAINTQSLSSLGQLPHLESLEIHGITPMHTSPVRLPNDIRNLSLPENSFPDLQRFALRNLHPEDVVLFWGLEAIVRNLDQVEVVLDIVAEFTSSDKRALAIRFSSEFLPALSARSSRATKLVIDFNSNHPFERVEVITLDIGKLDPLSSLPLKQVELRSICIKTNDMRGIATLWPSVIELKLPSQPVSSDALHHFASLSNLRHLTLDIFWAQTWKGPKSILPNPEMLPLHTLEFSTRPEHELTALSIEDHARYLLSFWPNLQNLFAPTISYNTTNLISFSALASFIKLARALAETKRRITKQYGHEAAQSLMPQEILYFP